MGGQQFKPYLEVLSYFIVNSNDYSFHFCYFDLALFWICIFLFPSRIMSYLLCSPFQVFFSNVFIFFSFFTLSERSFLFYAFRSLIMSSISAGTTFQWGRSVPWTAGCPLEDHSAFTTTRALWIWISVYTDFSAGVPQYFGHVNLDPTARC